eukprot:1063596-Pyramimonas_sp.AAC.1
MWWGSPRPRRCQVVRLAHFAPARRSCLGHGVGADATFARLAGLSLQAALGSPSAAGGLAAARSRILAR